MKTRAFTLVEMLVVIAIVAVLAGMLLPTLSRAREQARRTNCANNLGQVGRAMSIYHAANENYYPSYANWGSDAPALVPPLEAGAVRRVVEYQNLARYDRLSSRHMVIAFASGNPPSHYQEGELNFIANGLGVMIDRDFLQDGRVLECPSMGGSGRTYYGHYDGADWQYHAYDVGVPFRRLGTSKHSTAITRGDGTWMTPRGDDNAVAILSALSYRLTPFLPDGTTNGAWQRKAAPAGGYARLENTRPHQTPEYMVPPFKNTRQLGGRALASDSFDFGRAAQWGGEGMAWMHHRDGYNVLYGDASVRWYADDDRRILRWPSEDMDHSFHDLTVSSRSSHEVWNRFDRAVDLDVP